MAVSSFYGSFPKIKYDINKSQYPKYEEVTDIFFRLGVLQDALNNISAYTVYDIEDGDTPELLAEKFYGDAGAGWIILLANNIVDGQFDWPLDYKSFEQFIIEKYGSVPTAQITEHHYEKVVTRRNTRTGIINETRFIVTDTVTPTSPEIYQIGDDTIEVTIKGESVSCYDHENRLNEDRRSIKVIKAEYYINIMDEFKFLTGQKPDYIRKLF